MTPVKLFIVDDHFMVIEGIHHLLANEKDIEWMGHAMNAASCMAFLSRQQPDVILMDVNLPDKSGIDLCKEVNNLYPGIYIVGLSTFNQHSFISKMMENGASGYLLKNASLPEIMDCITRVVKGEKYYSYDVSKLLQKSRNEQRPILTRRELEILQLIADGYTNNEIAGKLFISATTVDTHRKNLLEKLSSRNTAMLVRVAIQMGFLPGQS